MTSRPNPMPIGTIKLRKRRLSQYCMEMIANKEIKVFRLSLNSCAQSIGLSRKEYLLNTRLAVTADKIMKILNMRNRNNIMMSIVRYFEKKTLPMDCGDANTCFQALFLNSICGIKLQIRIINMGNKNALKTCHPCEK
jgi:hypothetical protein